TTLTDPTPGMGLDWDRSTGAGGATGPSPYLQSKDPALLVQYLKDKAPPGHIIASGKVESRTRAETTYRSWLLDQKQGMTGEYITDARVAIDNSPGAANRPCGR